MVSKEFNGYFGITRAEENILFFSHIGGLVKPLSVYNDFDGLNQVLFPFQYG